MKKLRSMVVAFNALGKNKLRSFLMMIGIVIGITAVTIIVSMALGSKAEVMERVERFGTDAINVFGMAMRAPGSGPRGRPVSSLKLDDALAIEQKVGNINFVAPMSMRWGADIRFEDKYLRSMLSAVTEDFIGMWEWDLEKGDFITRLDNERLARVVVIGPTVFNEFFPGEDPIGKTIKIENVPFEVKGVLADMGQSAGGRDMGNTVIIPLNTYLRRVANVETIDGIRIQVTDSKHLYETAEEIKEVIRENHGIMDGDEDDFSIITPTEVLAFSEHISGTFNVLLIIVAGISLVAGGVVVANIMLISVNERKFEIGLRKSVGARKIDILYQFLFETVAVTVSGGFIGVLLGILGAFLFKQFGKTPVSISWEGIAIGLGFSIIVGILSGIHPAVRASRMSPIEALRS